MLARRSWLNLIGTVVALSPLLAGCGNRRASTTLAVAASDFSFTPMEVRVPADQEITLTLTNKDGVTHAFVIIKAGEEVIAPFHDDDQAKVYWEAEIVAGKSATLKFTAPDLPGQYQIICRLAGHKELGMLTVIQ